MTHQYFDRYMEEAGEAPLILDEIKAWEWIEDPEHYRGRVPDMDCRERKVWNRLYEKKVTNRGYLPKSEFLILAALDRKVRYRAKKDKDGRY